MTKLKDSVISSITNYLERVLPPEVRVIIKPFDSKTNLDWQNPPPGITSIKDLKIKKGFTVGWKIITDDDTFGDFILCEKITLKNMERFIKFAKKGILELNEQLNNVQISR